MTSPYRIALFGECMIELRGQPFGTMQQGFGGDTLNTAVYLARLGRDEDIRVCYATALGTDPFSDHMITAWQTEGIDTSLVRRLDDRLPGLYAIQVDPSGERRFFYWREGSAVRGYFDVPITPLEAAAEDLAMLYLSGISLAVLPRTGRERLFAVMGRVRGNGKVVAFDNNFRPRLWADLEEARAIYQRTYPLSDILFITLEDEMTLHGETSVDRALSNIFSLGAREVVVKCGTRPTLMRIAGTPPIAVPVATVPRVIDTTAAGDSFAGAYLAMRLKGISPVEAARAANRMAAVVIQHPGAIIPTETMPPLELLVAAAATTDG